MYGKFHSVFCLFSIIAMACFPQHAYSDGSNVARSVDRIIGGVDAKSGDAAFTVSLAVNDQHTCGGSLISPILSMDDKVIGWQTSDRFARFVVTAAHCVTKDGFTSIDLNKIRVLSGATNLLSENLISQRVEKIYIHTDYHSRTLQNDIAILRLETLDQQNNNINLQDRKSIRLPQMRDFLWINNPYLATYAAGWGRTNSGSISDTLKEARLPTIDQDICRQNYSYFGKYVENTMICAGFSSGEFDSCQGDSGGPLFYRPSKAPTSPPYSPNPVLIGVVSWGLACANPNLFGVYTRVITHTEWINETVEDSVRKLGR